MIHNFLNADNLHAVKNRVFSVLSDEQLLVRPSDSTGGLFIAGAPEFRTDQHCAYVVAGLRKTVYKDT
jgi:hypothetical protein